VAWQLRPAQARPAARNRPSPRHDRLVTLLARMRLLGRFAVGWILYLVLCGYLVLVGYELWLLGMLAG
jgi:hypothetical protein